MNSKKGSLCVIGIKIVTAPAFVKLSLLLPLQKQSYQWSNERKTFTGYQSLNLKAVFQV